MGQMIQLPLCLKLIGVNQWFFDRTQLKVCVSVRDASHKQHFGRASEKSSNRATETKDNTFVSWKVI